MTLRVDRVVTSGTFSIDGEDFDVDNNIWLVGDEDEVLIVDAAHEHQPIVDAVGDRTVAAIVCTHGHNDHINAAVALAEAVGAPILLHPDDRMLWDAIYPDRAPDGELADGQVLTVAGESLWVLHTPGHSPGGCCLHDAGGGILFSGDTLFRRSVGRTDFPGGSWDDLVASIETRLLTLPGDLLVLPGHGEETTIAEESRLNPFVGDSSRPLA